MKKVNHKLDSSTVFGRVMLVFFWGSWSAIIVVYLDRFFHFTVMDAGFLWVAVNMLSVWSKNWIMGKFNK